MENLGSGCPLSALGVRGGEWPLSALGVRGGVAPFRVKAPRAEIPNEDRGVETGQKRVLRRSFLLRCSRLRFVQHEGWWVIFTRLGGPRAAPRLGDHGVGRDQKCAQKGIEVVVLATGFRFMPIAKRGYAGRFYSSDKAESRDPE